MSATNPSYLTAGDVVLILVVQRVCVIVKSIGLSRLAADIARYIEYWTLEGIIAWIPNRRRLVQSIKSVFPDIYQWYLVRYFNMVVNDMLRTLPHIFKTKGVEIRIVALVVTRLDWEVSCNVNSPPVVDDVVNSVQVIVNLDGNSIKARDGRLKVGCVTRHGTSCIIP